MLFKRIGGGFDPAGILQVWKSIYNYPGFFPESRRAWIFRIAVNVKNDALRLKQRSVPTVPEEQAVWQKMNQNEEDTDMRILVRIAFGQLP